ncbi:MAG: hypothetical protein OXC62_10475 [Aestuariivita sp.]|nr:hypothetical protein [Aestuariivita sp.]
MLSTFPPSSLKFPPTFASGSVLLHSAHFPSICNSIRIEKLLYAKLLTPDGQTLREELGMLVQRTVSRIKAVLNGPALSNEKISTEVTKVLAETEKVYAATRKINAEIDRLVMDNYRARHGFIRDLREMAMQLERDDWDDGLKVFDGFELSHKKLERSLTKNPLNNYNYLIHI